MKRLILYLLVIASGVGWADEIPSYSLGVPPVTPIRVTTEVAKNVWLTSNAVHVAMSSCFTNGTDAISSDEVDKLGDRPKYRLVSAEVGFSWERLKPDYYLGDKLDAPLNVNWVATFDRYQDLQRELALNTNPTPGQEELSLNNPLAGGFLFNTDETRPCVYAVEGGSHRFDWVLMNGETNSPIYVVAPVASGRPRRIYWTDPPYNGQKIGLQGKFVQFYGNPDLTNPGFGVVTNIIGGNVMVQTNVITRGIYLDRSSMTLEARGQFSGQAVMVYYDSGNYDAILSVQVIEVCPPDIIINSGTIGTALKPDGRGYNIQGLKPFVTAGIGNLADERGGYLYQHAGQHSYSPKNGEVYPIRPTEGQRWKAEVTWMETDEMGVLWPFEIDQYNLDWPEDISRYVRGNLVHDYGMDFGADIAITNAYVVELMKYQEPDGHARDVDTNGHFRTIGPGKSLLKLTGSDNVWFLPIESVWRDDKSLYTLTPSRVHVGAELELRSGTRAGIAKGARPFFVTDTLPGYIYQAGTPGKNYDQNIYSETNSASAIYPISTNGLIEVWWSERFQLDDMPAPIAIPSLPQVYKPIWPQPNDAPQIVIASQKGSANEMIYARYGAAYFDAVDATMMVPDRNYFPTNSGTVMFWTRSDHYANDPAPAATNAAGRLLTLSNGRKGPIVVEVAQKDAVPVICARVGESTLTCPLPKNEAPNIWHHVAVTFGGAGGASLYLDGVEMPRGNIGANDVSMDDDLPDDYIKVDYLESTREGGQYIDTGYTHKSNTRIMCSVSVAHEQACDFPAIFGAFNGDFQKNAFVFFPRFNPPYYQIDRPALCRTKYEQVGIPNSFPFDTRIDLVCEGTQASWRRYGETSICGSINNLRGIADDGQCAMNIFVINSNGSRPDNSWCAMRLYSFQIYEGNSLVRDFVPCIQVTDWSAGLYDRMDGKFYPNAGTGDAFKADWEPGNFLGAVNGDYPTAVGREMAEVKFFDRILTAKEIADERYASRSGDEDGITGYFSFRKGEDLASVVQSPEGDFRTFCDRTTGGDACLAYNVAYVEPGAPAKSGVILQSDTTPTIYYQNDPEAPGYNPNDEHAFVRAGSGGYVVWALRSDLATKDTPPLGVFAEYQTNGKNRLQFFHVIATNEEWKTLSAPCTAGLVLPGPHPLDFFENPWLPDDKWDSVKRNGRDCLAPAYRDRKGQIWARAAGELGIRMYYAMQEGFYFPSLKSNEQPAIGKAIPWLARHENPSADVLKDKPALWRWDISWPTNCVTMKIGQTLTTAVDDLPEVWNAKSVSVVYPIGFTDAKLADVGDVVATEAPVMLSDPTVMRSVKLSADDFKKTGLSIDANGGLTYKGGKYHFTELPPSLSSRLYYDNTNQKLCFIGQRVEKNAGATILYPNVLSKPERTSVLNLVKQEAVGYKAWTNAVSALAKEPFLPNTLTGTNDCSEAVTTYRPVDHYALTALGPTNYVVIIENDASESSMISPEVASTDFDMPSRVACPVADDDPINMHVFLVTNLYYTGRIVTREDEVNLLSQQLSVLYTEPFGGKPDNFEFEWKRAEPNANGTIPDDYEKLYTARPVNTTCGEDKGTTDNFGKGLTRFVVGQQGDTLANMVNTYWICRYRALPNTPAYKVMGDKWSGWCAPPALAEGWVQRVLNNVTPFNQRMTDLYENKAETAVSMIQQAGGPFTGDVALNQDNLTSIGLIQLYETILNKAESMSLLLGINNAGANKQLQLAVERLGDLYKVLGDEAYSDAKNPTIGFGENMEFMEQVEFASEASSLFCFDNQVNSLLDEELCLLRGRSGTSAPWTRTGPYYNRLLWNFTKGITAGEVAYAVNYNVSGTETTALSEEQAARAYPQGHGDAYGHYLSALKGWYRLLRNPNFSWGRPAQGEMNLADSAVNVDYYEEAKFAEAAADLAKTAADVVDLSARKAWRDNGKDSSGYLDSNITNAFGYGEWATRGGYGALVNWVTANSILPEDCTLESSQSYIDKGLTRIDRGTVDELCDICENADRIQSVLDRLDAGLNPIGLSDHAIPFDIAPGGVADGTTTHFEQVRDRAKTALANARKVLDRAQTQAKRMRLVAETAENYAGVIASEEEDFENQLITYYGTPYSDDIGPGKTYKQGYNGPDLIHYMWMDLKQYGISDKEDVVSRTVSYLDFKGSVLASKTAYDNIRNAVNDMMSVTNGTMKFEVTRSGLIKKPDNITGYRASPGTIQAKYGDVLLAYYGVTTAQSGFKKAYENYNNVKNYTSAVLGLRMTFDVYNELFLATSMAKLRSDYVMDNIAAQVEKMTTTVFSSLDNAKAAVPTVLGAGLSIVTSPRSIVEAASIPTKAADQYYKIALKDLEIKKAYSKLIVDEMKLGGKVAEDALKTYTDIYSYTEQFKSAALALNSAYHAEVEAMQQLEVAVDALRLELGNAEAVLDKREAVRKRQVNQLSQLRYNEMLFRKFRDKSLTRYSAAFDLAQKYVYMAAQAYDYETALKREDEGSGDAFISKIVSTRSLGAFDKDGEPMVADDGDLGLSGYLAQMDANWQVMKPRLGINNPQPYTTWFSLRGELFRILDGAEGDAAWAKELTKHWTDDILSDAEFRRYCQPFVSQFGLKEKEPGLIIPFETTIDFALNLFGNDLAGGDHAYDSSWYSTRIAAAGVWFDGYNAKMPNAASSAKAQLAETPVVYLVPVGYDCLRVPGLADGTYWRFSVLDQVIAAPYNIGSYELDSDMWMPSMNDADWEGGDATVKIRKHPSFRAYFDPAGGAPTDDRLDATRLIGRSVWNTRWLLVIPAGAMSADREKALSVFINGQDTNRDGKLDLKPVSDIKIGFRTYSQSGN